MMNTSQFTHNAIQEKRGVDNVSKVNCVRTEGEAKANLV